VDVRDRARGQGERGLRGLIRRAARESPLFHVTQRRPQERDAVWRAAARRSVWTKAAAERTTVAAKVTARVGLSQDGTTALVNSLPSRVRHRTPRGRNCTWRALTCTFWDRSPASRHWCMGVE